MRKTFQLTAPNKKPERQVEAVKFEIKKYIARERRKKLPEGADYWDFDCKIGADEEETSVIKVSMINSMLDKLVREGHTSFYLEILAKLGHKAKKPDVLAEETKSE